MLESWLLHILVVWLWQLTLPVFYLIGEDGDNAICLPQTVNNKINIHKMLRMKPQNNSFAGPETLFC